MKQKEATAHGSIHGIKHSKLKASALAGLQPPGRCGAFAVTRARFSAFCLFCFFFASTSSQFDFSDPVCQPTLLVWNKSHRKHQQLMAPEPDVDLLTHG